MRGRHRLVLHPPEGGREVLPRCYAMLRNATQCYLGAGAWPT
ncbi:Hypothetical protein CAP_1050 [Chondromyces apiculatus DSM 436]|uniref:Uncharacterized protein n=1 Tax=Chondromyces apiculatus DSM 436 TaxID=1192034 RepID=A0A017SVB0_9BACT|nr:Hypothetical protein CAP_1050 [Chondromyces apiculatus DSM 436]